MYPAEVPEGSHLLDASYIDLHTPRKLSNILNQCKDNDEAGPSNSANYSQFSKFQLILKLLLLNLAYSLLTASTEKKKKINLDYSS
jgi:hypothetical protein